MKEKSPNLENIEGPHQIPNRINSKKHMLRYCVNLSKVKVNKNLKTETPCLEGKTTRKKVDFLSETR
jgi:hypothetical protein